MNAKCDDTDLGEATKKFDISEFKANNTEVKFYCKGNNDCNKNQEIENALKENVAETIEEMKKVNEDHKKAIENNTTIKPTDPQTTEAAQTTEANAGLDSGAAQTTVAVATIAFSTVMARLAL